MLAVNQFFGVLDMAKVDKKAKKVRKDQEKNTLRDRIQFDAEINAEFAYAQELLAAKQKELKVIQRDIIKAQKEREEILIKQQKIRDECLQLLDKLDNLSEEESLQLVAAWYTRRPVEKADESKMSVNDDDDDDSYNQTDYSFTKMDFLAATATAAISSCIGTAIYKLFF